MNNHPIFFSDISTRRVQVLDSDGMKPEYVEAVRRKVQAHLPVIMDDAFKYFAQDQAVRDYLDRRR